MAKAYVGTIITGRGRNAILPCLEVKQFQVLYVSNSIHNDMFDMHVESYTDVSDTAVWNIAIVRPLQREQPSPNPAIVRPL